MRHPLVLALVLFSSPLSAQATAHTIAPGMTKAQVIASLGEPATMRTVGEDSYLFYLNTCGKQCGMNDLVVLHADSVSDAIFRSPTRHYSGKSSSPVSISPRNARRDKPAAADKPLAVKAKPPVKAAPAHPAATTKSPVKQSGPEMKTPIGPREKPVPPAQPAKKPADSTGKAPARMKPAPANDTRPSIPLHPPVVQPAAGTKPPTKTP